MWGLAVARRRVFVATRLVIAKEMLKSQLPKGGAKKPLRETPEKRPAGTI